MIDLNRSRRELLAEIDASDPFVGPVCEITDPRVLTAAAHVRLQGHGKEDLFPLLRVVLTERFAAVPRVVLVRDLLMPLRHALGNAYRHGNGRDPVKAITVEVVLTRKGAFLGVTDEGDGFDVPLTVERLRQQRTDSERHGAGIRGLDRAVSPVTWEHGGRTLLFRFRPSSEEADAPDATMEEGRPAGAEAATTGGDPALRRILDPAWIQTCLSRELAQFREGRAKLDACHPYLHREPAGDGCGVRFVLRISRPDLPRDETRILTGRLHADEAAAAADFDASAHLHAAQEGKRVRIPKPVARPTSEPRLILYDFDPWMDLWQYLAYHGRPKTLLHVAERVGRALAALHRSRGAFRPADPDSIRTQYLQMVAGVERGLEQLPGGSDLVERFRTSVRRVEDRGPVRLRRPRTPIHGAMGWDSIHYGVDGLFYFYRFEKCHLSDPLIDLGGFAADVLRFALAGNVGAYQVYCEALLTAYNARAEYPVDQDDLPFYTAVAIGERLREANMRATADAEPLLAALDAVGDRELTE